MKRLLIGDHRDDLLSTLEIILRHWGYRVLVSSQPPQIKELLRETTPSLLVMGARLLTQQDTALVQAVNHHVLERKCPLIILQEETVPVSIAVPHETLGVPLDLFSLFSLIQKHLEAHPRQNLRLAIRLPGMLCTGETCHLAEVLSLSTNGMFVKTSFRAAENANLRVTIPLMGMKKELEIKGRILYRVEPGSGNNYFQGVGIEFTELNEESHQALQEFLAHRFIGDLATRPGGEQLRFTAKQPRQGGITLRLDPY
jgi:Tfp pilus assembly protein PilZ